MCYFYPQTITSHSPKLKPFRTIDKLRDCLTFTLKFTSNHQVSAADTTNDASGFLEEVADQKVSSHNSSCFTFPSPTMSNAAVFKIPGYNPCNHILNSTLVLVEMKFNF